MLDVRRTLLGLGALVLLGATGMGLAIAQDDREPADVPVRQQAQLTTEEQGAEAERIETRGTQISRRVMSMLDEARRERDIIRVTCLNDKLTQINAHLRTLQSRRQNLQEAVQTGDDGRRNHEFTVITVLGQHFTTLEQEANQCIGQDIFETGTTQVVTTIDPSTPDEDPSTLPQPPGPGVPFVPPPAS